MTLLIIASGTALAISFTCSLLEATLLSYTPSQVAALEGKQPRIFRIWRKFKDDIEMPIAVILVTNTISHTVGATIAGAQAENVFGGQGLVIFSLVFTFLMLQFTEILPKSLGVRYNRSLALVIAPPLEVLVRVMRPLLWAIHLINRPFGGSREEDDTTLEQISGLAATARLSRVIDPQHARMIEATSEIEDIKVRHIMTPRTDVISLRADQPIDEILKIIKDCPYTRLPLYRESIDDIIGIINLRDILTALELMPGRFRIEEILPETPEEDVRVDAVPGAGAHVFGSGSIDLAAIKRDVIFLPENVNILQALRQFQTERQHMAIVVDEYGATAGIVTLEDVLEEVVGEIEDEFDPAPRDMMQPEGEGYRVKGRLMLYELEQNIKSLELNLDESQADTVGGYVTERLERMPVMGDSVEISGWKWTVTKADVKQVHEVLLMPAAPLDEDERARREREG